jgi:hypothetical protein
MFLGRYVHVFIFSNFYDVTYYEELLAFGVHNIWHLYATDALAIYLKTGWQMVCLQFTQPWAASFYPTSIPSLVALTCHLARSSFLAPRSPLPVFLNSVLLCQVTCYQCFTAKRSISVIQQHGHRVLSHRQLYAIILLRPDHDIYDSFTAQQFGIRLVY